MNHYRLRFAWVLVSLACGIAAANDTEKPSILFIMADDVGIEGLGCYGGASYQTPHLDQLAAEGVRFTHAYSQPLCTPTRVQVMTGLYNHRNWKYFGILRKDAKTFGHYLQSHGYKTGIFGKWQLQSYDPPDFPNGAARRGTGMHPKDAGFDQYALFHSLHTEDKGSRYSNPTMLEGAAKNEGELKKYDGRYGEDVWVEKILSFFEQHRDQPTFVYYPMALPHHPFEPTPRTPVWDPTKPQPEPDPRMITDMIETMDDVVGRLRAGLRRLDLDKKTVVIFYSDNGTHQQVQSKMKDERTIHGGKAMPTQTGIHVPLIARWPGRTQPSVSDRLIDASDIFPTLGEIAQAPLEQPLDGISFAGELLGQRDLSRPAAFFWYDPRPGWDKERFGRSVFALDHHHKLFRDGRLFRFTELPLQEVLVKPSEMTVADLEAKRRLGKIIEEKMSGSKEPPLVDANGDPL